MKRCPKCHRFGIDYSNIGHEQCPWKDCLWINSKNIDLNKVKHPIKFKKFIDSISKTKYKSYREQGIECSQNGNRIEIPCYWCNHSILVCIKYKTYCHSKVCLKDRLENEHS